MRSHSQFRSSKGRCHDNHFSAFYIWGAHIGATWRIRLTVRVSRRCGLMSNYFDHLWSKQTDNKRRQNRHRTVQHSRTSSCIKEGKEMDWIEDREGGKQAKEKTDWERNFSISYRNCRVGGVEWRVVHFGKLRWRLWTACKPSTWLNL